MGELYTVGPSSPVQVPFNAYASSVTVANLGPDTVYYKADVTVSAARNDGTLPPGASLTISTVTAFLAWSSTARLYASDVVQAVGGGGGPSDATIGVPAPFSYKGAWAAATNYVAHDVVRSGNLNWICVAPHTSGGSFPGEGTYWAGWRQAVYNAQLYGVTGDGVTDDYAALQGLINSVNTAGGGDVLLPPGTYKCLTNLTLPGKVSLVGASRRSVILLFPINTGTGTYCVTVQNPTGAVASRITDLQVYGPVSVLDGTGMDGFGLIGGISGPIFERVYVHNVRACWALDTDHTTLSHCNVAACWYSLYFYSPQATSGDMTFDRCEFDGATQASVGVGDNATCGGALFTNCHFGYAPYGFYKEAGAGANVNVVSACCFVRCSFENVHAALFKAASGNRSMDATFIHCASSPWLDPIAGEAAINMGANGTIAVTTIGYNPFTGPGPTATFIGNLSGSRLDGSGTMISQANTNSVPILPVGSTPSNTMFTANPRDESRLSKLAGTVARYDLVMADTYEQVKKWDPAVGKAPVGVALLAGTVGQSIPVQYKGRATINRAGTDITDNGKYLKPSAATPGCVDLASGFADGPIVGVSEGAATGATATVPAKLSMT